MHTQRSVFVKLPTPKAHNNSNANAQGPITAIQLMTDIEEVDGKTFITSLYWAEDGEDADCFMALSDLCSAFDFNLNEITDIIARALVEIAGEDQ